MTAKPIPEKITGGPLPYLLYTSDVAETARVQLPLILFLHGVGERGFNLEKVKIRGLTDILGRRDPFPEAAFVVAPQCPEDSNWELELSALETLLDEVHRHYPIDPARIYITGLSMGGYGAWHLALRRPARFAALAPICGGGNPSLAYKLKTLPIWAFHGAEDTTVPPSESTSMVEAIKKVGGDVRLSVYPDTGHDSWTAAYSEPDLYRWLFAQRQTG